MNYFDFLDQLLTLTSLDVRYMANFDVSQAGSHHVFVGCGRFSESAGPFVLSNKGIPSKWKDAAPSSSATKLIRYCPDAYLESFSLWQERPLLIHDAASALTLVAEDASPDSVFSLVVFFARLAGVETASFPEAWIDAVDAWEVEGLAQNPEESWCALESVLAHRHFPTTAGITDKKLSRAWLESIRFAAHCLRRQADPLKIGRMPDSAEYLYARAALEQERETYQNWLERATQVQVALPLFGTEDRDLVVDGLLIEARQVTGATKVYFRNDRECSPLKRGFAFSAVYTPEKGADDAEITVSVDPSSGLHLRPLWAALEEAENEAWLRSGRVRPTDLPRRVDGVENRFNEPWYITPNGTLIGRPRRLPTGELGSLLSWRDVQQVIWTTLGLLRNVEVSELSTGVRQPLLRLTCEPSHSKHDKHFLGAKWIGVRDAESMVMPPRRSRFFLRMLAGLIERNPSSAMGYNDLPPLGSWETLDLSGGFLVATHNGIFVLEDATAEPLDASAIREAFHHAAELDHWLRMFEQTKLGNLAAGVSALLEKRSSASKIDDLLLEASNQETQIAHKRGSLAVVPGHSDARALRKLLGERWSLDKRLDAFEGEIHAVETSLRSLNELRTLRIGRFIATYGFAVVLAASVAPFIAKAAFHARYGGPEIDAPGRTIVFWFFGLSSTFFAFIAAWFNIENPLSRKRTP